MEWKRGTYSVTTLEPLGLGNFLSGMETLFAVDAQGVDSTLETSLVEWKLRPGESPRRCAAALETSLVEWKRVAFVLSED